MRNKSTIKHLDGMASNITWPEYNYVFETYKRKLEQVIEENVGCGPDVQVHYNEDEKKFYVTFERSRWPGSVCSIIIRRSVDIDPNKPLTPQLKALLDIKDEMIEMVHVLSRPLEFKLMDEMGVDLPDNKVTQQARALSAACDKLKALQEDEEQDNG